MDSLVCYLALSMVIEGIIRLLIVFIFRFNLYTALGLVVCMKSVLPTG